MKMKKAYFLIVLFLCGLSVGNVFAAAPARTWADWARSLFPGAGTAPAAGLLEQELIIAALVGNEPAIERLIARGADVNAQDPDGYTALIWAARRGYENIVKMLLQVERIDVNAADRYGETALIWAARRGHENIVEKLLQVDGIDVNAVGQDGETALMLAAFTGHKNIVKMLLDAEADRTIQTRHNQTAEAMARENHHEDLANMIRDYGSGRTVKRAVTGPDINYL